MDILLWIVAWLLIGCGVAWMIGGAAAMGEAPIDEHALHHDAVENIVHFPVGERAQDEVGAELSAAAGNRSAPIAQHVE
jgi:hypothetical protein